MLLIFKMFLFLLLSFKSDVEIYHNNTELKNFILLEE